MTHTLNVSLTLNTIGVNNMHHAELAEVSHDGVGSVAWGKIFNDTKTENNHPFPDGALVHTSRIREIKAVDGETFIITMNTTYKVIE
ncbi:hypothetical protein [Yersinia phage vB_YenM_P778]